MINSQELIQIQIPRDGRERHNGFGVLARMKQAKAAFEYVLEQGYDHWIVSFSGGKDSTGAVVMALETALEHIREVQRIDVIYADTRIEIPTIHQYALSFLHNLRNLSRVKQLPLHLHVVHPEVKHRFWTCMLGRGYPPPHQKFRWCTWRLKIQPIENRLRRFVCSNRSVIVTGVRMGESQARNQRLVQSCKRGGECGQGLWFKYSGRLKAGYLAPLIDWTSCDVWDFVSLIAPNLGYQTAQLENVYNGRETRFGCWTCTVVRQDKAMEKTIARPGWGHLTALADFRKHIWEVTRSPKTRERRSDGRPGRLRYGVRKALLSRLLTVQEETGVELITAEEILSIKEIWRRERYHS